MNNIMDRLVNHFTNLTARQAAYWAAALTGLVIAVSIAVTYVGERNAGIEQELGMVSQWNAMQARYSQGRLAVVDGLNIAGKHKDGLVQLLKSGVGRRSRFTDNDGRLDRNRFISVVREAYPELDGLQVYDRLLIEVQALRQAFAGDQDKLHDMVRGYETWRTTGGLFHPFIVEQLGFPSRLLEIHIGNTVLTGPDALDKLSRAIISKDAADIFESGKDRRLSR
ncbi:MAG: hypothetical protein U0103_16590 [Candidatus Obscuribacterales bacterium]